jgi:lipoprotein-anchoring transpeptidase ErfK/SrfK
MRHRSFIAVAVFLAVLILGAVGAYAYDSARKDRIAEGISVAGIELGEMSASEARAALRTSFTARLSEPITLTAGGREFSIRPERLGARAEVRRMVAAAVERSRRGGMPGRVWRGLTGAELDVSLPAQVTHSPGATERFLRRMKDRVDRPARDADVRASGNGVEKVPGRSGRTLQIGALREQLVAALKGRVPGRVIEAPVEVTKPEVTFRELERKYPYFITIDRPSFRLHFYKRLRRVKSYVVGVGQVGFETPAGLYHIQNKAVNPAWSVPNRPWAGSLAGRVIPPGPENPIKSRWMGIYDGAGIHGTADTASLGTAASHGCIRMSIPEVEELYEQVPVETPVYIG